MAKAKDASTTIPTRRSFLVTGSAAAGAIAGVTMAPAIAAPTSGISPELQTLVRTMEAARAEFERLKKIDYEARELYLSMAPPIPAKIIEPADHHGVFQDQYKGHRRYVTRSMEGANGVFILMSSYWLKGSPIHRPTRERLAETARIADEFVSADDAAHQAADTEATNAAMDAAMDVVSDAEDAVENFPARSFADLVIIASLAKAQICHDAISDDFCGILVSHILSLSKLAV